MGILLKFRPCCSRTLEKNERWTLCCSGNFRHTNKSIDHLKGSKGCVPMSSFDLLHQKMNHWLNYLELSWNVLHTHLTPDVIFELWLPKRMHVQYKTMAALYLLFCGSVQLGNKNDQGHPAEIEHFRCCLRFFLSHWPLFCSISCLTARLGGHVVGSARPVPGQSDHQSTGPLQANTFHRERSQEGQWSTRTSNCA